MKRATMQHSQKKPLPDAGGKLQKRDKQQLLITSLVCLLPMLLAAALYSELPGQIAVHWNNAGVADGFLPRAAAAFGLPVLMMLIHLFVQIPLLADPKRGAQSAAVRKLLMWLIPLLSLVLQTVILFIAIGRDIPIVMLVSAGLGLLLMVMGNLLPKSRQNYTVGIRLPWTLDNADNWNKTHRLAGRLWMGGGLLMFCLALALPQADFGLMLPLGLVLVLSIIPMIYSYVLHKRDSAS